MKSNSNKINENFPTENMSRIWAYLIVDALVKKGVTSFYLSPGMRNSPLINAVVKHPEATPYIGMDERAQGFRALGHAKTSEKAAALICTSGSALSHYFPAVLEASKSSTPLIVMSADRPLPLSESDANQTLNQKKIFSQHVRNFLDLGTPTPQISPVQLQALVSKIASKTQQSNPGPVHLNIPFDEPLDQTHDNDTWGEFKQKYIQQAKRTLESQRAQLKTLTTTQMLDSRSLEFLQETIQKAQRPLIVIGELHGKNNRQAAKKFAQELELPLVLDVTSGIKFSFNLKDGVSPAFDHPEVYEAYIKNPPDVIFHFGGRISAKYYDKFLGACPEIETFVFQDTTGHHDPALRFNHRAISSLSSIFEQISSLLKNKKTHNTPISWSDFVERKSTLIDQSPLAYPSLSKSLIESIDSQFQLYLGNSTVIRSFDSYASETHRSELDCFYHRGTSGIEGFMAASLGLAEASAKPVCLVLGDVSAYHDLNSLELLKQNPWPILIIIVNNGGGGIFSLLPIGEQKDIRDHLFTPHQINFTQIASSFEISSQKVETIDLWPAEFKKAQKQVLETKRPMILEVMIDDATNTQIYQKLRTIKL